MGQKVSAFVLRLGINQSWQSRYFPPKREQANWLRQDKLIRDFFTRFPEITRVKIERTETELIVFVYSSNISLITNENNGSLDNILAKIAKILNDEKITVRVRLEKETSLAWLIAKDLAKQIKDRNPCNLVLRSVLNKLDWNTKGIYVLLSGRLDGSAMTKDKTVKQGNMPSSSFESSIKEVKTEANTAYGKIGITVKVYENKEKK